MNGSESGDLSRRSYAKPPPPRLNSKEAKPPCPDSGSASVPRDHSAPPTRKDKGRAAEEAAALHLQREGWDIAERNWSCRTGELDLIATQGETVLFVEVRSRSGIGFGLPAESVDARKIRQVRRTAEVYLHRFGLSDRPVRFDVIAVMLGRDLRVRSLEHIREAF
ncbi:YraN family protein [Saccharibacillus alkalitolerans]|uniref:UPF0102 protein GYN08_09325 n=1 Tax=Saccharibacillus alkalitolerans TaxID=2705290 RepID=A0ABX0FBV7_9BACL|nr:YraN family protein [Saccharibacillus alkalitolerans]NGZ75522.1 YraN family protein [Saccharibacillus alkalitolerans]